MKNEVLIINEENIKEKIYYIRGQKVLLDVDLAKLYGYTTKAFNQQVQRNIEKFDNDFMFQLTKQETEDISRSQIVTLNETIGRGHNIKYLPYAFTESGVYMLMTILKGELAIKQSKALIRIFKGMKDYIIDNNNLLSYDNILKLSIQTTENTKAIEEIRKDMATKNDILTIMRELSKFSYKDEMLILNGEEVESNLAYNKIYNLAHNRIYIIDDYINLKTLVLLKNIGKNVKVIIFSDNVNNGLHKLEYEDFIKEYKLNITFKHTNRIYHDRYIIIDYNTDCEHIFHAGSSSKDSGRKITTITEIQDKSLFKNIIDKILENDELILK